MKSTARVCSPARAGFFALALVVVLGVGAARAQNEPVLVPDAIDYQKLLPILPEPPSGWTADKPEGSTEDVGGFKITNVHRDYRKGEGEKAPSTAIASSIQLRTLIMSARRPKRGRATATPAKVTPNR